MVKARLAEESHTAPMGIASYPSFMKDWSECFNCKNGQLLHATRKSTHDDWARLSQRGLERHGAGES